MTETYKYSAINYDIFHYIINYAVEYFFLQPQNPYIHHLKAHGIVHKEDKLDEGKVAKEVASHHIYNCYFRGRHFATDPNERDSHIYHYK